MIAARCPRASVALVDRDRDALRCVRTALGRPANAAFANRVDVIEADVRSPESERAGAGLARMSADMVVANPPFRDRKKFDASPNPDRCSAHLLDEEGIGPWIRCSASVLKPGGRLIFILGADLLAAVLDRLVKGFGAVDILPIHPRADLPAARVLILAVKNSRAALRILPPLVLHGPVGSAYLRDVDTVLRGAAGLGDVHRCWGRARAGAPPETRYPRK